MRCNSFGRSQIILDNCVCLKNCRLCGVAVVFSWAGCRILRQFRADVTKSFIDSFSLLSPLLVAMFVALTKINQSNMHYNFPSDNDFKLAMVSFPRSASRTMANLTDTFNLGCHPCQIINYVCVFIISTMFNRIVYIFYIKHAQLFVHGNLIRLVFIEKRPEPHDIHHLDGKPFRAKNITTNFVDNLHFERGNCSAN